MKKPGQQPPGFRDLSSHFSEGARYRDEVFRKIVAQPGYTETRVPPTGIRLRTDTPMALPAWNKSLGLTQSLHGVIKDGSEMFGVVKVASGSRSLPGFILTQFEQPGQRASIVGEIRGDHLHVGRDYQAYDDTNMAGDSFSIVHDDGKGEMVIRDRGSLSGVQLVQGPGTPEAFHVPALETPKRGFGAAILSRVFGAVEVENNLPLNPLEDISLWSPESLEAATLLIK